jgi:hypothetical protein
MFGLALILAFAGMASAQSSDRDNPTVLSSGEISGSLDNHNGESFYSFTAGPGELTVTVDVTVNHRSDETQIGVLNYELLGRDASTSLLCCEFAQTGDSGTGRDVKSVKLTRRQTVILHHEWTRWRWNFPRVSERCEFLQRFNRRGQLRQE